MASPDDYKLETPYPFLTQPETYELAVRWYLDDMCARASRALPDGHTHEDTARAILAEIAKDARATGLYGMHEDKENDHDADPGAGASPAQARGDH